MQEKFIIAQNHYGQKILLDPEDIIGKKILKNGIYDKTGLYFIEKILSKLNMSAIVFDIGASIGNHALRMSQYCEMVYLFEPQVELAAHLNTTATLNNITNWKICNIGLSDEEKTLNFYKNLDSNIQSSFVSELKGEKFTTVESKVCIGDEIVNQYSLDRLDFIKIDVEGYEAKVIAGLKNSIRKFRPIIFMEWDKEITKQQFQEQGLFTKIFSDYFIKAITRMPYETSIYKRLQGKLRRLFSSGIARKRWTIGDFAPELNYKHIVFVPQEKMYVLNELQ